MFDALQDADPGTLLEVSYHVGQRFFERQRFRDEEARRRRIIAAFGSEVDERLLELIEAVIAEIEECKATPFAELSEGEFLPYRDALSKMREQREPPMKPLTQEELRQIEEFRREYGMAA